VPVTPTYPGVYIEEISSGVRTITGVATSVAAFIGYFNRGPLDTPVQLFSIGDFEREFGGLTFEDQTGYAICQFYINGGSVAYVVRVASPSPEVPEVPEGSEVPGPVLVPPAAAEATLRAGGNANPT